MAYPRTNSYTFGPSSPAIPRRGFWSRQRVTIPAPNDVDPTDKKIDAYCAPCFGGIFTATSIFLILFFIDRAHSDAKFSIQSIAALSPSSDVTTWHVDFLVKNPSSRRYSVYYEDVSVRLGPLNAAVLNVTHQRDSKDVTTFSLAFVAAKNNRTDAGLERLDVKLNGKHKLYLNHIDEAGHFDITCHSFKRSSICQCSFTELYFIPPCKRGGYDYCN